MVTSIHLRLLRALWVLPGLVLFPGLDTAGAEEKPTSSTGIEFEIGQEQTLHSYSIRGTFSSIDIIGAKVTQEFRAYDVGASFKLPWLQRSTAGWKSSTRLLASAGVLHGDSDTGATVSFTPQVVFDIGNQRKIFSLDMGAGVAMLSEHQYGTQDFGGHFQFTLTGGLSIPLNKHFELGYRYFHYSDAGLIGPDTTGADLHMIELIYLP